METDRDRLREELRLWGRRTLRGIWRRRGDGGELSEEERRLAGILDDHPQFASAWEGEETEEGDAGFGDMNPFLHVQIHMIVESQLASGRPEEVGRALARLEKEGRGRHDAIHDIGKILTLELHRALQEKRSFDMESYLDALRALGPPAH